VEQVEGEVEVVQQRLSELQALREMRVKEAADAAGALEEAQGKLAKIVQVGEHVVGLREWLT
jgi:hypothetical protein